MDFDAFGFSVDGAVVHAKHLLHVEQSKRQLQAARAQRREAQVDAWRAHAPWLHRLSPIELDTNILRQLTNSAVAHDPVLGDACSVRPLCAKVEAKGAALP